MNMSIKLKLVLVLLAVSLLPLTISNSIFFIYERKAVARDFISHLESVASIQHSRISSIYAQNLERLMLVASRTHLLTGLVDFHNNEKQRGREKIIRSITDAKESVADFKAISVYDVNGMVVASTERELIGKNEAGREAFIVGLKQFNANLFVRDTKEKQGELTVLLSCPIYNGEEIIGVVVIESTAENLLASISDYTGLGKSGETILASRNDKGDAVFLMPTRFVQSAALEIQIEKIRKDIPIIYAINGEEAVYTDFKDYRDVPVLAVTRHIEDPGWGLVVKIDKEEAFSNLINTRNLLILFFSLSTTVIIYLSIYLSKKITLPIIKLTDAAKEIVEGDTSVSADESSSDEIGSLGQAFNEMTSSLIRVKSDLEVKVEQLQEKREELLATAERFKRWQNSNFIGIIHAKASGEIIDANDTLLNMLDFSKSELKEGKLNWMKMSPPEYTHVDRKAINEANDKGYWTPFEQEFVQNNGRRIPVLIGGSIFEYDIQEYILFVIDLTERKRIEEELRQYARIVSSSTDMLALLNKNYIYIAANPAYVNKFNLSYEKLIGHHISDVFGESFFENVIKLNADRCLAGEELNFQHWFDFPAIGKKFMNVSYFPYIDAENEIQGFVVSARDVTAEHQAQLRVLQKEREQRDLLDSMMNAVITIDEKGLITSFNKAAEILFGYIKGEIIGKSVNLLMPERFSKLHDSYLLRYLETGVSHVIGRNQEVEAKRKNNEIFPMRLSVAELPKDERGKRRYVGSCLDLTAIKLQEEQLRRAQKMDALGKLTGGIAHDFNNMLGVILGYGEILSKRLKHNSQMAAYVDQICRAGERGANLTRKLLSFSRQQSAKAMRVDINQLIEADIDMLRKSLTARIELKLKLSPKLWAIKIDANSFDDMLLNMSINAMHAMPSGGDLTFSTSNETLSDIDASMFGLKAGDYVALTIEDNGCGMSKDIQAKIFDPFFTTKTDGGTGLGLSQVYGFVRSSGGHIDVYSEVDLGTRFIIYFPRDLEDIIDELTRDNPDSDILFGSETILVVDDEQALCDLAREIFVSHGYQVLTASSGVDALKHLEYKSVDLLITDIIMPQMNGYQLAQKVHRLYPRLWILFASGFRGEKDDLASGITFDEVIINKPYQARELLTIVREQLDRSKNYRGKDLDVAPTGKKAPAVALGSFRQTEDSLQEECSGSEITQNQHFEQVKPLTVNWNEVMSIDEGGILDNDHKHLITILNQCLQIITEDNYQQPLRQALSELKTFIELHFKHEEVVMKACEYPYFQNHKGVHKVMIRNLKDILKNQSDKKLREWTTNFLTDWLLEHVLVMDKAIAPFIQSKQVEVKQAIDAFTNKSD